MKNSHVFSSSPAPRARSRRSHVLSAALLCGLSMAVACSDDDDDGNGNAAGSGGRGGSAGAGGAAGNAGNAGSAGAAGTAGNAGSAGTAGTGGAGPGADGPLGTITVLNADATALRAPTTAAIRGTDLWVVNGQLDQVGGEPTLPFNLVSVPLAGGPIGATQIELPEDDFFPEGIAAAPDGTLFVGSVTRGTIVRIPAGSTTPDEDEFVEAGVAQRGVIGLTVDADTLWFCDSAQGEGGDIVGVDVETGVQTVRHAMPDPGAPSGGDAGADAGDAGADAGDAGDAGAAPTGPTTFCNDLVVAPSGDLFATDSTGRVFRVEADAKDVDDSASVWLSHPAITTPGGFGANGIDVVGDQLIIAANGTLVAVDPESGNPASTVQVFDLTEGGAPATLCGPDGLQAVPDSDDQIIVVENGFCAPPTRERVVRVTLSDLD